MKGSTMAIKALNIAATEWFTPDSDPDKGTDNATQFELATLDSYVMASIQDELTEFTPDPETKTASSKINVHGAALKATRFGVKGIKNFLDAKGNAVELKFVSTMIGNKKYQVLAPEVLALIPAGVCLEIYRRLREINEPTREDLGNSEGASLH
jgi:hypothetical protein